MKKDNKNFSNSSIGLLKKKSTTKQDISKVNVKHKDKVTIKGKEKENISVLSKKNNINDKKKDINTLNHSTNIKMNEKESLTLNNSIMNIEYDHKNVDINGQVELLNEEMKEKKIELDNINKNDNLHNHSNINHVHISIANKFKREDNMDVLKKDNNEEILSNKLYQEKKDITYKINDLEKKIILDDKSNMKDEDNIDILNKNNFYVSDNDIKHINDGIHIFDNYNGDNDDRYNINNEYNSDSNNTNNIHNDNNSDNSYNSHNSYNSNSYNRHNDDNNDIYITNNDNYTYDYEDQKNVHKNSKDIDEEKPCNIYDNILKRLNIEKNENLENSHIIIFGNKDVGKSCLVKALQEICINNDEQNDYPFYCNKNRVLPLDYACLKVKNMDENRKMKDIKINSHIWILQHPSYIHSLIKNIKNFKNVKNIIILICTDLYKPYNIMSDINNWIDTLYILFEAIHSNTSLKTLNQLKEKMENYIYDYKNNILEKGGKRDDHKNEELKDTHEKINNITDSNNNTISNNNNNNNMVSQDKERLIKINLTFPIFFIICKSDGYEILNNRTYQGYMDVIISYLRNLAINYHAAIIYCNTINKENPKNIELLYKYIMHRLYNFPFNEKPILNDYEKIFIPSGYDNIELINKSIKNTFVENFNKPYDSIITKPIPNKSIVEQNENIVDDFYFNEFLANLSNDINKIKKNDENVSTWDKNKIDVIVNKNNIYTEENNENNLNKDKIDQSLHSFFQNLLAKGRSKSPSTPNINPTPLEKRNINL
ncbi:dynein light intermediate chain 2, cytosolic [Plasmodium sp. gorilla clade G2]|uniref:dynein light intermediate chain 2, cytosolic n=1 Tax=Plasmodium sp. gorilla clade G2 TaxID=880535 RepID=UPI000D206612|nr:dynein light intermediate chain 2, cytosolic [Plasmodium sp. gorilla clade G2]SOV13994.1 dynein light intermediate chain 2, cytosolic [Plasmodium sp. gorilla clade G2]